MSTATLGIETSGLSGRVALRSGGQLLAERELERAKRRHAQTLVSEVQRLLNDFGFKTHDVSLVAVSRGPGSFTGLRVGIVFAKTFAYATGCHLAAVDTLAAIAAAAPHGVSDIYAVVDAQRDELFAGHYVRGVAGYPERIGEIEIVRNEAWCQSVSRASGAVAVTGPGLEKMTGLLAAHVRQLDQSLWWPRAAQIAEIGERLADAGHFADPAGLEPFYLRKSAAEEKRAR